MLALALGATVDELQERMTSSEFDEWIEFYERDPWGERRADLRAGIIAAACVSPYSKRRVSPKDFMPDFGPKKEQTIEEQMAMIEGFLRDG